MSSYYATKFSKGVISGKLIEDCGSFSNITLDGRMSVENAIEIARNKFKKECAFKNTEYHGFKIEKLSRAWDYKNPTVVDTGK